MLKHSCLLELKIGTLGSVLPVKVEESSLSLADH